MVAPVGWTQPVPGEWQEYTLAYQFVDHFPPDGFSAWRLASDVTGESVEIAAGARCYAGGFAQHALNRFFSQAVLRCRPNVVVVVGLVGCTVDLLRVANLLEIPSVLILDAPSEPIESLDASTLAWLESSLSYCRHILTRSDEERALWPVEWLRDCALGDASNLGAVLTAMVEASAPVHRYDYSIYEFSQRDHPLLVNMQRGDTRHFADCGSVLDIACGVGIFLDCLQQQGINAQGVERDPRVAEYARGMGLNVATDDALAFLSKSSARFDGIYCSHFIEHLPTEAVQELLQLLANRLEAGGVLVLVFPDPESIRSQLLGFWRDPEHVRFYHPELVTTMAATLGLELEWSSYDEQPHRVGPFPDIPLPVDQIDPLPALAEPPVIRVEGFKEKLLRKLGLVSETRLQQLQTQMLAWSNAVVAQSRQQAVARQQLEQRTDALWDINQTWAWNDNVTLKLRKSAG
jgi:O-antigen chain-terminating methyltransferase